MEFNKIQFRMFREDAEKALEEVAKKYNLKIKTGAINYSEFDFKMTLECAKYSDDLNIEEEKFKLECTLFGFNPENYGQEFTLSGKRFKLVGFHLRSPKNNCSIKCLDDSKFYKASDESVKRAMKIA